MKLFFSKLSTSPIFYFIVALFVSNSLFMGYYVIQLFNIYPKVLDLETFGYSAQKVNAIFNAYGKEGLLLYKKLQIGDLFFPVTVFLFFGTILYKRYKDEGSWIYYLPVIYIVADYFENYFLWSFRILYPTIDASLVNISSVFSIAKHSSIILINLPRKKELYFIYNFILKHIKHS